MARRLIGEQLRHSLQRVHLAVAADDLAIVRVEHPVVVVCEDLRDKPSLGELTAHESGEPGLVLDGQSHARIAGGVELRLILQSDRVDRDALLAGRLERT